MKQEPNTLFDTILHRILRVPYRLYVREYQAPSNPTATLVLIHGLGNSSEAWQELARLVPSNVRVIAVDMLGFGRSPKPRWVTYNIAVQARAVAHTVLRLRLTQRPIVVGHSMGSLVAIELARRFPLVLRQLVLCSPPLYKSTADEWVGREKILKDFYKLVMKYPEQFEKIVPLAGKLGIVSQAFNVKGEIAKVYIAALESSIINQSSLDDIRKLQLPITIVYGVLDPVVIGPYMAQLGKEKENIAVKKLIVGHEINGIYVGLLAGELKKILGQ